MSAHEVSVTVAGKVVLSADTKQFEEDLKRAKTGLIGGGGPAPTADPATIGSAPPTALPDARAGYFGSAEDAARQAARMHMSIDASLAGTRTLAEVRRLEDRLNRAERYGQHSGKDDLVDALKELREALEQRRAEITEAGAGGAGGAGGGGGTPPASPSPNPGGGGTPPAWAQTLLQGLSRQGSSAVGGLLGRAVGGGAIGSLLGSGAGALLGGPVGWILGGLSAAGAAFTLGDRYINASTRAARTEYQGQADLARQYGIDRDLMGTFRPGGWTNARFARLGYDATEAARVASLYDRPGGMVGDTESILQFSRTTGTNADRVAGLAQALSYAGVGTSAFNLNRGGNIDDGLRVMKLAVSEGIKDGISGSTTMQALTGYASRNAAEGRSMSTSGLALFAQLTDRLTGTRGASSVLRGAGAADVVQNVMNGIGSPNDPGLEYLMLNAIGAPSAMSLGMTEKGPDGQPWLTSEGSVYEGMRASSPLEAGRYLLDRIKSGKNPGLLSQAMRSIDSAAGTNTALKVRLYQQAFNLSPEQAVQLVGAGGAEAFGSDPAGLQRFIQGQSLLDDKQGGNRINNDSMALSVAERDREMMKSLGNLAALGNMQNSLSDIKNDVASIRYAFFNWIGSYGNPQGSLAGRAGSGYTDPRWAPAPSVPPAGGGAGGAAAAAPPTTGSTLDRTLWSLAQVETSGGTNIRTSSTGAEGLYQIQPQNISRTWKSATGSAGGWDKDYLGEDARNPDGSIVTTTAQASAWLKANPDKANQIATRITQERMATIKKSWNAQGFKYTDADVAGMVGAWWTSNDGAVLDGNRVRLPDELRDAQTAREKAIKTLSPGQYFDKARGYYLQSLEHAAVPTGGAGSGTPPQITFPQAAGQGFLANVAGGDSAYRLTQGFGANAAYIDPRTGKKVDKFGYGFAGHNGWDIALGKNGIDGKTGAPVYSPFRGKVYFGQEKDAKGKLIGYGNWAKLVGDSGASILFGHLNQFPNGVRSGQTIRDGDIIGYEGSSGNSTAAHVHVEVRDARGRAVDPNTLLGGWMNNQLRLAGQGKEASFQRGGWTGSGPSHEEAGIVHHEEFVVRAGPAARYRQLLERVNAGLTPSAPSGGTLGGRIDLNVSGTATFQIPGLSPDLQNKIDLLWHAFLAQTGQVLTQAAAQPTGGPR